MNWPKMQLTNISKLVVGRNSDSCGETCRRPCRITNDGPIRPIPWRPTISATPRTSGSGRVHAHDQTNRALTIA